MVYAHTQKNVVKIKPSDDSLPGLAECPVDVGVWPGVHTGGGAQGRRRESPQEHYADTPLAPREEVRCSKCSVHPKLINCGAKQLYSA